MSVKNISNIEYTCIGHCCHDLADEGYTLGGTASYSASVARGLGAHSKMITAYGHDFLFQKDLIRQKIELINTGSECTTVFENIYGEGARQQVIHSRADVLKADKISAYLNHSNIIHLCPIADEIDYHIVKQLDSDLVAATIQGSLRCWDQNGRVKTCAMDYSLLEGIDVVIISDEDIIGIEDAIDQIKEVVPLVVVTQGKIGAKVYLVNSTIFFPSYRINQRRETGAGDTFAAAFFIRYYQTGDPVHASIYAHAVCSLVLERDALAAFPKKHEIEKRVGLYQKI